MRALGEAIMTGPSDSWTIGVRRREMARCLLSFRLVQLDGMVFPFAKTRNTEGTTRFED